MTYISCDLQTINSEGNMLLVYYHICLMLRSLLLYAVCYGHQRGMQIITNCQCLCKCLCILHHILADALVSKQVFATYPKYRYEVMRSCWDADPKQRPTFSQLVTTITSILNSLADYLEVSTFATEEQATNEMEKGM